MKNYLGNDSSIVKVEMTRSQALKLGIVRCEHCRYPPNNHFDFGQKKCAHDGSCPGYKEQIFLPSKE